MNKGHFVPYITVLIIRCILSISLLIILCLLSYYNKRNPSTRSPISIYVTSFGSICIEILSVIQYSMNINVLSLSIDINQKYCRINYAIYIILGGLLRYFFLNFLLWRIKITFAEPQSLSLTKRSFFFHLALIHILLFTLCIPLFLDSNITLQGIL